MAEDSTYHGSGGDEVAEMGNVISIATARVRYSAEAPLNDDELRQLRRLLAIADRIENMVSKAELLLHRCPTARRVISDQERDGG